MPVDQERARIQAEGRAVAAEDVVRDERVLAGADHALSAGVAERNLDSFPDHGVLAVDGGGAVGIGEDRVVWKSRFPDDAVQVVFHAAPHRDDDRAKFADLGDRGP